MKSEYAIKLTKVSKRFKLYHNVVTGPIKELLFIWKRQQYYKEFKAIKDVSFGVKKGEVVGIIGPNGAGKTTLLKMIAGLLPVDGGRIEVNGKVTALLALGVGVHPEFTGRENIFYGGMLLGMSKREVLRKMSQIIEFSELGEFIEQPFRTYSAGMRARLLFSISMSIDPDILIVDEALAAGDAYFVQKSSERIRKICRSGATILVVSHNMSQIESLCHRAIVLDKGEVFADTDPISAHHLYSQLVFQQEKGRHPLTLNSELTRTGGTGEVVVSSVTLLDENDRPQTGFITFRTLKVHLKLRAKEGQPEVFLFVGFLDAQTFTYVGGVNTKRFYHSINGRVECLPIHVENELEMEIIFSPLYLFTGHYLLWIEIADKRRHIFSDYKGICPFFVSEEGAVAAKEAYINHPIKIEIYDPIYKRSDSPDEKVKSHEISSDEESK
jgi:ABC-type polysaccharide/polyol phosphate transport system ATPase subunit